MKWYNSMRWLILHVRISLFMFHMVICHILAQHRSSTIGDFLPSSAINVYLMVIVTHQANFKRKLYTKLMKFVYSLLREDRYSYWIIAVLTVCHTTRVILVCKKWTWIFKQCENLAVGHTMVQRHEIIGSWYTWLCLVVGKNIVEEQVQVTWCLAQQLVIIFEFLLF